MGSDLLENDVFAVQRMKLLVSKALVHIASESVRLAFSLKLETDVLTVFENIIHVVIYLDLLGSTLRRRDGIPELRKDLAALFLRGSSLLFPEIHAKIAVNHLHCAVSYLIGEDTFLPHEFRQRIVVCSKLFFVRLIKHRTDILIDLFHGRIHIVVEERSLVFIQQILRSIVACYTRSPCAHKHLP